MLTIINPSSLTRFWKGEDTESNKTLDLPAFHTPSRLHPQRRWHKDGKLIFVETDVLGLALKPHIWNRG